MSEVGLLLLLILLVPAAMLITAALKDPSDSAPPKPYSHRENSLPTPKEEK